MTVPNYRCTQQEVFTTAEIILQSCLQHQPAFFDFSPMYTIAWIEEQQLFLTTTSQLPDEQARGAQKEVLHIELEKEAATALASAQKLKRYITKAFKPEFQKTRLEEAGFNHYEKASNNDWEACRALLTSGVNFIATHAAVLQQNLNMPPTFQATYEAGKTTFFQKHQAFIDSEETYSIDTDTRQVAINQVHSTSMSICLDGQQIFKDNEAIRKQFVFEEVLFLVSGAGTAGFKGTVTDAVTGLPIQDVEFTLKASTKTTLSDADGKFKIIELASGDWEVTATKQGYQTNKFTQKVKVGTVSTVDMAMQPA